MFQNANTTEEKLSVIDSLIAETKISLRENKKELVRREASYQDDLVAMVLYDQPHKDQVRKAVERVKGRIADGPIIIQGLGLKRDELLLEKASEKDWKVRQQAEFEVLKVKLKKHQTEKRFIFLVQNFKQLAEGLGWQQEAKEYLSELNSVKLGA